MSYLLLFPKAYYFTPLCQHSWWACLTHDWKREIVTLQIFSLSPTKTNPGKATSDLKVAKSSVLSTYTALHKRCIQYCWHTTSENIYPLLNLVPSDLFFSDFFPPLFFQAPYMKFPRILIYITAYFSFSSWDIVYKNFCVIFIGLMFVPIMSDTNVPCTFIRWLSSSFIF